MRGDDEDTTSWPLGYDPEPVEDTEDLDTQGHPRPCGCPGDGDPHLADCPLLTR